MGSRMKNFNIIGVPCGFEAGGVDTPMHCMNHEQNYLSENVLCSKNDKIVTEIYLKSLGTKKR